MQSVCFNGTLYNKAFHFYFLHPGDFMKLDKTMIGILIGASLFVGFVIISVAVGSVFPSLHKLTAPLICSGNVEVETIKYSYKPGQVGWATTIYCAENSGERREITFAAIALTGLIASAVMFVIFGIWMRKSLFLPENFGALANDLKPKKGPSAKNKKEGTALERLSELKKMYDENLITRDEYEKKKSKIMEEL
jgi:hypothetical protein